MWTFGPIFNADDAHDHKKVRAFGRQRRANAQNYRRDNPRSRGGASTDQLSETTFLEKDKALPAAGYIRELNSDFLYAFTWSHSFVSECGQGLCLTLSRAAPGEWHKIKTTLKIAKSSALHPMMARRSRNGLMNFHSEETNAIYLCQIFAGHNIDGNRPDCHGYWPERMTIDGSSIKEELVARGVINSRFWSPRT